MFGIGFTEIVIVALIALVVVGPDKLPEIANYIGKLLGTFRKANVEIKQTLRDIKPPDVMDIIETRLKEEASEVMEGVADGSDNKGTDSETTDSEELVRGEKTKAVEETKKSN